MYCFATQILSILYGILCTLCTHIATNMHIYAWTFCTLAILVFGVSRLVCHSKAQLPLNIKKPLKKIKMVFDVIQCVQNSPKLL